MSFGRKFKHYKCGLFDSREEHDACGVGFVANIHGERSTMVIEQANTMLNRMEHRGACGCDDETGDGAGVMTGIPYELYERFAKEAGVTLPPLGEFAVGMLFVNEKDKVEEVIHRFAKYAEECEMRVLFWRKADVNNSQIGVVAASAEPVTVQVFVVSSEKKEDFINMKFICKVFFLRKYASHQLEMDEIAYICSLSPNTVVYKGMFTSRQLWDYFEDLQSPDFKTHFAIVHNRFSTNTFPSWSRAHPQRMMAHNGEINTLRGNVNYARARQALMESTRFGNRLKQLFPIIESGMSDSGCFDNLLEFLCYCSTRSLPEVVISMIPEAWQADKSMPEHKRYFYKWAASLLEPWDGPALIVFSDGRYIGAILDRNGLRPARYYTTTDGMIYMSSEVGVVDLPDVVGVKAKCRLKPGRLLIVDTQAGELLNDEQLKQDIASRYPIFEWVREGAVDLEQLHEARGPIDIAEVAAFSLRMTTEITGDSNNVGTINTRSLAYDPRLLLFGVTPENLRMLLMPMLLNQKEALGSMGNDVPLACLSQYDPLIYDYFKQLFAQVTNPPIDPFRERIVMSLACPIGPEANVLEPSPFQAHRLWLSQPILSLKDILLFRRLQSPLPATQISPSCTSHVYGWRSRLLEASFAVYPGIQPREMGGLMRGALEMLCITAETAIRCEGVSIIIISDRRLSKDTVPVPSLLALGAVHQHLLKVDLRMKVGLVVESGDAREVHHFCTLLSFGADAICPYMVFEMLQRLRNEGMLALDGADSEKFSDEVFFKNYVNAVGNGILKVMAKMGISTLQSYKAAQIFEAVGLAKEVIDMCFTGTVSRISGAGFDVLATEVCSRHAKAFGLLYTANGSCIASPLDSVVDLGPDGSLFSRNPGFYYWRSGGERHMNDPVTIAKLQAAARGNSREIFRQFSESADEQARYCTLRGQFDFNFAKEPILVDLVEPATEIVKKFATGAMSLGSISEETHSTLAKVMNTIGGRSNTGEGGELPDRYLNPSLSSSIKQVASARFGVNSSYLAHAEVLQIKMAQGAKPGEGGELPGYKVTAEIAHLRHSVPGVGLISPPPHHDIYSIEDLAQLIYDLKAANPMAVVSVKLVSEVGVGVIASGVAKAHAAHIIVSGHDGGTGASSWTGIKNAGLPWELGVAEAHQVLVNNHTRSKVVLQADGQIRTARDVVIAAILGADEFAMSTAPLIVLGCTMMRKCHLNTCPVGICTQDPVLRKKFSGLPEHLINYFFLLAEDVRRLLAQLGFTRLNDLTGRTELLRQRSNPTNEKAACLDLSPLLAMPVSPFKDLIVDQRPPGLLVWDSMASVDVLDAPLHCGIGGITVEASPTLRLARSLPPDRHWDRRLLIAAIPLLETPCGMGGKDDDVLPVVRISGAITNEDRAFGASLSYAISMKFNEEGLPKTRRLEVNLRGHAGQSFCAFLAPGVYVSLTGDANDYVAKGLSGGKVTIVPASRLLTKNFHSEDHIIVGNACLYGAIEGRVFIRGQAAERFCVRNSGAIVVAEGCGDHGCEYMTGGRVVLLGRSGRNFAAGMSGGLAFVYDADRVFKARCNIQTVTLFDMTLENEYATWLCTIIRTFFDETGSLVARQILKHFNTEVTNFILVFPNDYRAALEAMTAKNGTLPIDAPTSANGDSISAVTDDEDAVAAEAAKFVANGIKTIDIEDALKDPVVGGAAIEMERPDKLRGFVKYPRTKLKYRSVEERLRDWSEVYAHASLRRGLKTQAARCMDCGVPFCQSSFGCPLGNLIPNWNDLVHKDQWLAAHEAMAQTNNFPEFTGRVCPAPCEGACVLGIIELPVTIKNIECVIGEVGWERGLNVPRPLPASKLSGKRVAIIGSGPSGLACAAQLTKVGHKVVVMERRDLPGGLMRYGIPTMKLDRRILDRRLDLMRADGVDFLCNVQVGSSSMDPNATCRPADEVVKVVPAKKLLEDFDAVVLCLGSTWPRDLNIPGRNLEGIHFAMSFLERWQRRQSKVTKLTTTASVSTSSVEAWLRDSGELTDLPTLAHNKRVVVIGGGDTGVDCIATATRQGAKSVETLEITAKPPSNRDPRTNPWPEWPLIFRTDYGHEEVAVHYGRDPRTFSICTKAFVAATEDPTRLGGLDTVMVRWEKSKEGGSEGRLRLVEIPGTEKTIECDMALLAMGFLGPEKSILEELNLDTDVRSNVKTTGGKFATSVPRVYAAGDCRRGQSLVVHAINEGRQAARQVDIDLMGNSTLPGPGGIILPGSTKVRA